MRSRFRDLGFAIGHVPTGPGNDEKRGEYLAAYQSVCSKCLSRLRLMFPPCV